MLTKYIKSVLCAVVVLLFYIWDACCLKVNLLTPNDDYSGRTAPLTSKCCILNIYSTNTGTEHFKHGIYSPFFPLQNAVCFINLTYLVSVLFKFNIQGVLKFKKKNSSGAESLKRTTGMAHLRILLQAVSPKQAYNSALPCYRVLSLY